MSFGLYACATDPEHVGYKSLVKSLSSIPIHNIGANLKWEGMKSKLTALERVADHAVQTRVDLAIVVDAYDVIAHPQVAKRLETLLAVFQRNNELQLLVGREALCLANCAPLSKEFRKASGLGFFDFLNGGVLAIRPSELLRFLAWTRSQKLEDDQIALGQYLSAFPERGKMDVSSELLVYNVSPIEGVLPKQYLSRLAPFIHFPGSRGMGYAQGWKTACKVWGRTDVTLKHEAPIVTALLLILCVLFYLAPISTVSFILPFVMLLK